VEYKNSIIEQIGNTPLIKLNRINKGLKPQIFAKLESANLAEAWKIELDSVWSQMLKSEELKTRWNNNRSNKRNTGIGLAITAAVKGYRCIFVVTSKVSAEKINYLKALGAEVIVVSNLVDPDDPEYYVNVARRLSTEIPNSFLRINTLILQTLNSLQNNRTRNLETDRWKDHSFYFQHGTGGTISGTGKF